jgi:hypothetical protein
MIKSASQILREYSNLIAEECELWNNDESFDAQNMNSDNNDPVQMLATYLDNNDSKSNKTFYDAIDKFLKENNLEIIPVGSLTNKQGVV